MLSDIKKRVYVASRSLMFEQNSEVLWVKFKALVEPLLNRFQQGGGIKSFSLKKSALTKKTRLVVIIEIVPLYAIETFDVRINITDEDVEVIED